MVVREEWTVEVFDVELMRLGPPGEEEETMEVLHVCVVRAPGQWP
jgi:hypothetical protein